MIYLGCVLLPVTVPALIPVLGNNLRLELSCNHVFGSKALFSFWCFGEGSDIKSAS